jgi:hypothetical protein
MADIARLFPLNNSFMESTNSQLQDADDLAECVSVQESLLLDGDFDGAWALLAHWLS